MAQRTVNYLLIIVDGAELAPLTILLCIATAQSEPPWPSSCAMRRQKANPPDQCHLYG